MIEAAISVTGLICRRYAFAQVIVPAKGSILASLIIADWDPLPDYFFHWIRDAAVVMRAVVDLMRAATNKTEHERWRQHFNDIVEFSLALKALDGAEMLRQTDYSSIAHGIFRKFLRPPT